MPYANNPLLPKARRLAVNEVLVQGKKVDEVAAKYGVHRATLYRWIEKGRADRKSFIYNRSSAPHSHPNQLPEDIVKAIVDTRIESGHRCAEVVQHMLLQQGIDVSLASIKRVIRKQGLSKKTKRVIDYGTRFKRPSVKAPGDLFELDTIHYIADSGLRFFIYAGIDLFSRYGYLKYASRIGVERTKIVTRNILEATPFHLQVIQTDNGGEFGMGYTMYLERKGIKHRHTRVRKPNDNAHVERFIRTVKEECFSRQLPRRRFITQQLREYVDFYNQDRVHLGIDLMTPVQRLESVA